MTSTKSRVESPADDKQYVPESSSDPADSGFAAPESAGREALVERLIWELERTQRADDYRFAVLALHFNRLRVLDDCLEWELSLVEHIRHRLEEASRDSDMVARLGPDEFAVVTGGVSDREHAQLIASRIWEEATQPIRAGGRKLIPQGAVCAALADARYRHANELVRDLDLSLLRSQSRSGRQIQVVEPPEHRDLLRSIELETEIVRDLEAGRFELHYQPIVDVRSGQAVGFESLIRWHHSERGFLPAREFIPVAEENGLIGRMDEWVLDQACQRLETWAAAGGEETPFLTVNLSRCDLADPDFGRRAARTISSRDIDPSLLRIEITETEIVEAHSILRDNVERLADTGASIWIDDFGVGASSMRCIQRLPISGIKIDREFIRVDSTSREAEASDDYRSGGDGMLAALVQMGTALDLQLVAEGVETLEELGRVRETDCLLAQGYLFSRSVGPGQVGGLLGCTLIPDETPEVGSDD